MADHWDLPHTLGALRRSNFSEEQIGCRTVKDELRNNLLLRLQNGEPLFPGIVGYEETVEPQIGACAGPGTGSARPRVSQP